MFYPKGFVPFFELQQLFNEAGRQKYPTKPGSKTPFLENGLIDWANDQYFMAEVYSQYALGKYIDSLTHTYACSPKGKVIKMNTGVFSMEEGFDSIWFAIEEIDGEDFAPLENIEHAKTQYTNFQTRYPLIENNTWTINAKKKSKAWKHSKEQAYSYAHAKALKPLEGWALCMNETSAPKSTEDVFAIVEENNDPSKKIIKLGGRPDKQVRAKYLFQIHFPSGKKHSTWKQVIRILEQESNFSVSEATLKRALGQQ